MDDITHLILMYRECARNLWNVYILKQLFKFEKNDRSGWDIKDEYDEICTMLFSILVLSPIGRSSFNKSHSYEKYQDAIPFLHVVPCNEIPILINREATHTSGYWDYPVKCVKQADVEMRFVDFFDFDKLGFRDYEYIQVRIVESAKNSDLIGRDALIIPQYVKVFHNPMAK